MDVKIPVKKIIELKFAVKKKINPENMTQQKTIEPIDPEIVLLGLILDIFGPFKIFPNTQPPTSDAIQPNKREKIIIFKYINFEK